MIYNVLATTIVFLVGGGSEGAKRLGLRRSELLTSLDYSFLFEVASYSFAFAATLLLHSLTTLRFVIQVYLYNTRDPTK